jgi:hypothetical protein
LAEADHCRFEFDKRSQLFVGVHNETVSVAMSIHDPNRSPVAIVAPAEMRLRTWHPAVF